MKNITILKCIIGVYGLFLSVAQAENKQLLDVTVKPLSSVLISSKQSTPATVVNLNTTTISSEITGRAYKVYPEVGDNVKSKQRLVALDCRSYQLQKKQAEASLKVSLAQLNLAKKQLRRNQQLVAKGTVPREVLDSAQASQETSLADIEFKKAQIEIAQLAVDRCVIRAPFNGQVTKRLVQKGQLLTPGTPLYELMQLDRLDIKTKLSPSDTRALQEQEEITFVTKTQNYKVKLRTVIKLIDETTRTQEVRLSLIDKTSVPAGLSGRIEWSNSQQKIPAEFILRNSNGDLGVLIAENSVEGTAKAKFTILPNAVEGQPVFSDLSPNTLIINKNRYRVTDGELISIQKD